MGKVRKESELNIRLKPEEKEKIKKRAKRAGLSMSEYGRIQMCSDNRKAEKERWVGNQIVQIQEIANYVLEEYGEDDELERMVEELWESI